MSSWFNWPQGKWHIISPNQWGRQKWGSASPKWCHFHDILQPTLITFSHSCGSFMLCCTTTQQGQNKWSLIFFSCIQQISFMHSTWWNKRWKYCLCIKAACRPRYVSVEPESGCASSSFSSTKLRPLTQPTSQTCVHTHRHRDAILLCGRRRPLLGVRGKVGDWKGSCL